MTAHSKLGASTMHRWSECPGSVRLSEGVPNKQSKYAEEGTKAHDVAAHVLTHDGVWPVDVDDEMADAVAVYTDLVFKEWEPESQRFVEQKFDLSSVYPGCFGTTDCAVYYPSKKLLRVYDYKHGAGVAVDVERNVQLMYYGLGALISTAVPCETVELVIVQPRCPHPQGPIRRWSLPAFELLDFAADLVDFAMRTEDPNAPLKAGDHCKFCPAAGKCPLIHKQAVSLAKEEFRSDLSYDPQKLAQVLDWLPTFEGWIKSVRDFAYGEAEHGRCPPGWKLVQKRATRKWRSESDAAAALMEKFKLENFEVFDHSLRSPAQIEKLLKKEEKEFLNELIVSESSGCTLAPESDPRPAAKLDAKSEFEVIAASTA